MLETNEKKSQQEIEYVKKNTNGNFTAEKYNYQFFFFFNKTSMGGLNNIVERTEESVNLKTIEVT